MFLDSIDKIEGFFKALDRVNIVAFNLWTDKQADALKTGTMHLIESKYRTYISEMRQLSEELVTLQRHIEEEKQEIYRLQREIADIKRDGTINNCYSAVAEGFYDIDKEHAGQEYFAVAFNEDAKEMAYERCHDLAIITDAHTSNSL